MLRWLPVALCLTALALATSSGAGVVRAHSQNCAASGSPSIAFDGTNYLVVWTSGRWRGHNWVSSGVCGTRVSRAGAVRDPGGLTITPQTPLPPTGFSRSPSVAFGDRNHLVVWMDQRSGLDGDVYGSRVSPRGNVLEEAGLRLTRSSGYVEKHPALAFDGTNYLLVWEHQRDPYPGNVDILGVLVNSTGEVLREMQISSGQRPGARPVVAFDGTNFLVVWGRGVGCAEICGARVSRSGSVLDAGGIPISGLDYASNPAVAFDGTNYLVVWNGSGPEITFTRVTPTGNVLEPGGIPIGRGSSPAVALAGGNYLVAWLNSGYDYDVRGTRVSPSGTVLDPVAIRISRGALPEVPSVAPAVAFDGTNALVVWSDRGIFGARVNSAGTVLDPRGILIATSPHRCVVPRVVGLRLARAKARIPSANCRLGLLGRVRSTRPGRVLAQRPYAGARRPRGTPVNLLVGVRRR